MKPLLAVALFFALPACAQGTLTTEEKQRLVADVAATFEERFVNEARGREIAAELRRIELPAATTPAEFATAMTAAIHKIENDGHLRLTWNAGGGTQPGPPGFSPEVARKNNYDFRRVRHLDGNVGYFEVNLLHPPQAARETVTALFQFLQHVDAMIIDLRGTRGGSQEMVNLISSYFFPADGRELLTSRFRDQAPRVSRVVDVGGKRLEKTDLYILIGPGTFSAGEALAYILQQYGRATIVGEKTHGGGRHNAFVPLGNGFTFSVSVGEVVHPVSKRGWQGTGVIPDVVTKADDNPVDVAHNLALQKMKKG
ncbi:MAG TPA: S41 family peptidase [Thermoanaerobaculia bacterium]